MFSKNSTIKSTEDFSPIIHEIKRILDEADAIIIGAGAGLSTSAGLEYGGERFQKLFPEYIEKYNLTDMYSAAFYEHETLEEHWGYWCKHIYHNRYAPKLNDTYERLFELIHDKNYFVITTNADHLFIANGFDKNRLFYTQGDYGLFQCSVPCHSKTYDNKKTIMKMIKNVEDLKIPTELIPRCPKCNEPMTVNLRKDDTFVEDEGWQKALYRYEDFLSQNAGKKIVFFELGIGGNTPSIIKFPFWKMTYENENANYICFNLNQAICPIEIEHQSICLNGDIKNLIDEILA